MEHRIGEIITLLDGRKAEVVEDKELVQCRVCIFGKTSICKGRNCLGVLRTDGKNIIYKEIKEDK